MEEIWSRRTSVEDKGIEANDDLAKAIKEGHEKEAAEYYGFSDRELVEIKSDLQRKGWLD